MDNTIKFPSKFRQDAQQSQKQPTNTPAHTPTYDTNTQHTNTPQLSQLHATPQSQYPPQSTPIIHSTPISHLPSNDIIIDETENFVPAKEIINMKVFKPSFWDDMPLKRTDPIDVMPIIDWEFAYNDVTTNKTILPTGFKWVDLDFSDTNSRQTVTTFLQKHFTTHHNPLFDRLYDQQYFNWLTTKPYRHYNRISLTEMKYWCIGVEVESNNSLVGTIFAQPITLIVDGNYLFTFEINFLCTHSKLRKKQLAKVLMREMYRRCSIHNCNIGLFFATPVPMPFRPFVSPINLLYLPLSKKGFSAWYSCLRINDNKINSSKHLYPGPTKGLSLIRFATKKDIPILFNIYKQYQTKYNLSRGYNKKEFIHEFLPTHFDHVLTYVITTTNGEIKDFISIEKANTKEGLILGHLKFVSFITDELLIWFFQNVLWILRTNGFDGVISGDNHGIEKILIQKLDFKRLDNYRHYHLFNYNVQQIPKHKCGMSIRC